MLGRRWAGASLARAGDARACGPARPAPDGGCGCGPRVRAGCGRSKNCAGPALVGRRGGAAAPRRCGPRGGGASRAARGRGAGHTKPAAVRVRGGLSHSSLAGPGMARQAMRAIPLAGKPAGLSRSSLARCGCIPENRAGGGVGGWGGGYRIRPFGCAADPSLSAPGCSRAHPSPFGARRLFRRAGFGGPEKPAAGGCGVMAARRAACERVPTLALWARGPTKAWALRAFVCSARWLLFSFLFPRAASGRDPGPRGQLACGGPGSERFGARIIPFRLRPGHPEPGDAQPCLRPHLPGQPRGPPDPPE